MLQVLVAIASVVTIVAVLVDAFEAILQPRRVAHRFRITRFFYRSTWRAWRAVATHFQKLHRREAFLSFFGPLSLLTLFVVWFVTLIVAFAMLHWAADTKLSGHQIAPSVGTFLYMSGVTFFTLGYGDIVPLDGLGRFLAVLETGMGFGFMAVVISYLPTLYQAFSARERAIQLLDARAGSPPTATEMLTRLASAGRTAYADHFLREWEDWCADLLENHLSFPLLTFYRSQHENQSWLATLTMILDTCSLILVGVKEADRYQAQLTFAMARHAAVDLALVMWVPPMPVPYDRLPPENLAKLLEKLKATGASACDVAMAEEKLTELRAMYEPVVYGLSHWLLFNIPSFFPDKPSVDNWQTSPWSKRTPGIGNLPTVGPEHFA